MLCGTEATGRWARRATSAGEVSRGSSSAIHVTERGLDGRDRGHLHRAAGGRGDPHIANHREVLERRWRAVVHHAGLATPTPAVGPTQVHLVQRYAPDGCAPLDRRRDEAQGGGRVGGDAARPDSGAGSDRPRRADSPHLALHIGPATDPVPGPATDHAKDVTVVVPLIEHVTSQEDEPLEVDEVWMWSCPEGGGLADSTSGVRPLVCGEVDEFDPCGERAGVASCGFEGACTPLEPRGSPVRRGSQQTSAGLEGRQSAATPRRPRRP